MKRVICSMVILLTLLSACVAPLESPSPCNREHLDDHTCETPIPVVPTVTIVATYKNESGVSYGRLDKLEVYSDGTVRWFIYYNDKVVTQTPYTVSEFLAEQTKTGHQINPRLWRLEE